MAQRIQPEPKKEVEISIIVATFNCGVYLEPLLRSIKAQTYKNYEVIIVDDGSTDNTEKYLTTKKLPVEVNYFRRPHKNQIVARNFGVSKANGRYYYFPDADSVLMPLCLELLRRALIRETRASYAYCDYARTGEIKFNHKARPFNAEFLKNDNFVSMCSLFRKEDWIPLDENIPGLMLEDWDIALSLLAKGKIGVYVPHSLFTAFVRTDGVTMSRHRYIQNAHQYIKQKYSNNTKRI